MHEILRTNNAVRISAKVVNELESSTYVKWSVVSPSSRED